MNAGCTVHAHTFTLFHAVLTRRDRTANLPGEDNELIIQQVHVCVVCNKAWQWKIDRRCAGKNHYRLEPFFHTKRSKTITIGTKSVTVKQQ
jgi:hypothetical protein